MSGLGGAAEEQAGDWAIETSGLGRRFGELTAVEDLSLRIRRGETFTLLGPNGAGKTTTVRMLCTLIAPTSGSARILGRDVVGQAGQVRASVGLLTEAPGLYDRLSPRQILTFYAGLHDLPLADHAIEKYLQLLDLWRWRDKPTGGFSKGMKQKVALARAILHEPDVLFLDEPTSGLDVPTAKLVRELLGEWKAKGRTILMTTHNLDEAERLSDRIGVLSRRLLVADTPAALRQRFAAHQLRIRLAGSPADHLELLRRQPGVRAARVEGEELWLEIEEPERETPALVTALVGEGARIRAVEEIQMPLEEIYLGLVGGMGEEE